MSKILFAKLSFHSSFSISF